MNRSWRAERNGIIVLRRRLNGDEINGCNSILFSEAVPPLHEVQLYRHDWEYTQVFRGRQSEVTTALHQIFLGHKKSESP